MSSNIAVLKMRLPKTAEQADRLKRLARRDHMVKIAITILRVRDRYLEQRTWRTLFGLYQDCACVRWSSGFTKKPGVPFVAKMRSSRLPLFLREAMPLVAEGRADISVDGERLRPRLLELMVG
jgi:hypothetical protein